MKTAEIFFANGSRLKQDYQAVVIEGEWLHFTGGLTGTVYLSVSSRAVLYIEHDIGA